MKLKTLLLGLMMGLLPFICSAQIEVPKREFRGAWIATVNGQFQGMSTEAMQRD